MKQEILNILHTMGLPNCLAAEMTVGLTTMHADVFAARLAEGLTHQEGDYASQIIAEHACPDCKDCG